MQVEKKHLGSDREIKGILWKERTAIYADNCYEHLKKSPERSKIFQEFQFIDYIMYNGFDEFKGLNKEEIIEKFSFPGKGKYERNFNYKKKEKRKKKNKEGIEKIVNACVGCKYPYPWNAHHLIPVSAFDLDLKIRGETKKVFKESQRDILLMSNYNINHGHNMMPLPAHGQDIFQPVHRLLQHPSDHRNYTIKVQKDMLKVAKKLERMEDGSPHPDLKKVMLTGLADIEDDLWSFIVIISVVIITAIICKVTPYLTDEEKKVVKFQTVKGATKYEFGALC